MATEMEQAASWNAIDAPDLASDTGDAAKLEVRANDVFAASLDALRLATAKPAEADLWFSATPTPESDDH